MSYVYVLYYNVGILAASFKIKFEVENQRLVFFLVGQI